MKLKELVVISSTDYAGIPVKGEYPVKRSGHVEFQGESGTMKFNLLSQDIIDIEQLLLNKTKILAVEA